MSLTPSDPVSSADPPIDAESLLGLLRRKEGSWVDWGRACQQLQKAGYSPQTIFEETGFEPIQQNQIIVGMQVYEGLIKADASAAVQEFFGYKGSDILYEFRILPQPDRVAAAELVLTKQLDRDEAYAIAKAMKQFAQLRTIPTGFTEHPGDATAYQAWRSAQQTSDLQERSRLIARALRFVHSDSARQQIEKLLTDFTIVPRRPAPLLPTYRIETNHELPRLIPLVGQLPLSKTDLQSVPVLEEEGPFRMVRFRGEGAWIALPGWQVLLNAEDPLAFLCPNELVATLQVPGSTPLNDPDELVLVIVDRAERTWQADAYSLMEQDDQVQITWFEDPPDQPLLGRVLMVVRPPRIFDEEATKDLWHIED